MDARNPTTNTTHTFFFVRPYSPAEELCLVPVFPEDGDAPPPPPPPLPLRPRPGAPLSALLGAAGLQPVQVLVLLLAGVVVVGDGDGRGGGDGPAGAGGPAHGDVDVGVAGRVATERGGGHQAHARATYRRVFFLQTFLLSLVLSLSLTVVDKRAIISCFIGRLLEDALTSVSFCTGTHRS